MFTKLGLQVTLGYDRRPNPILIEIVTKLPKALESQCISHAFPRHTPETLLLKKKQKKTV